MSTRRIPRPTWQAALDLYNESLRFRYRLRRATEQDAKKSFAAYVDGNTDRPWSLERKAAAIARCIAIETPRYLVGTFTNGRLMLNAGYLWDGAEQEGSTVLIEIPVGSNNFDHALYDFRTLAEQNRQNWLAWAAAEENDPDSEWDGTPGKIDPHEYIPAKRAAEISFVTGIPRRTLSEYHKTHRAAVKDSRRGPRH